MMKRAVRFALKRHREVEVIIVGGNHDPESSIWLAYTLAEAFSKDSRVTVRTDPRAHKYLQWGRCLIGTTHGDRGKVADLGQIMSVDQRENWGRAKFCHWYTGHVHHRTMQELRGCDAETLSVLCPGDSWHTAQGYRSRRGMKMDVWHKRQGRILEVPATVEYINDV
jgi:predicted phosphodiesterase